MKTKALTEACFETSRGDGEVNSPGSAVPVL